MPHAVRLGSIGAVVLGLILASAPAAAVGDRDRRCLTMLAYAEASGEGPAGMLAVMRVVHNRMAHAAFPDNACAVALEPGQFPPVGERKALRVALAEPEHISLADAVGALSPQARLQLVQAWRLAAVSDIWPARDPTGGALYFVNPRLMDPHRCPWVAALKRTAVIGQHVFMTQYADGEPRRGSALDCQQAGLGRKVAVAAR
jgi:spore germination cell wall hydrolase CwlJ-like protein